MQDRRLIKSLNQKGFFLDHRKKYLVEKVHDSGEIGGIVCEINIPHKEELLMISITHLRVEEDHPLTKKISDYQQARIKTL